MIKYLNKYGKVGLDESVFAAIAVETAMGFSGRVFLTNQKGKIIKESAAAGEKYSFINVTESKAQDSIELEIFVILKFGTSISWFTREYARRLRLEAESITGVTINKVIINITGIRSKRTARRELRVVC